MLLSQTTFKDRGSNRMNLYGQQKLNYYLQLFSLTYAIYKVLELGGKIIVIIINSPKVSKI